MPVLPNADICEDGQIRLSGGTLLEGRVEICLNEQYGTICSVGFDRAEAQVICGQLGYSRMRKQLAGIKGYDISLII